MGTCGIFASAVRCWKDGALQSLVWSILWHGGCHDPTGHEWIHGKAPGFHRGFDPSPVGVFTAKQKDSPHVEPLRHTVAKLIGSPPGYVGYDEESQLTDPAPWIPYDFGVVLRISCNLSSWKIDLRYEESHIAWFSSMRWKKHILMFSTSCALVCNDATIISNILDYPTGTKEMFFSKVASAGKWSFDWLKRKNWCLAAVVWSQNFSSTKTQYMNSYANST